MCVNDPSILGRPFGRNLQPTGSRTQNYSDIKINSSLGMNIDDPGVGKVTMTRANQLYSPIFIFPSSRLCVVIALRKFKSFIFPSSRLWIVIVMRKFNMTFFNTEKRRIHSLDCFEYFGTFEKGDWIGKNQQLVNFN